MNPGVPASHFGDGKQQIYLPSEFDNRQKTSEFYDEAYEICENLAVSGNSEAYFGVKLFCCIFEN